MDAATFLDRLTGQRYFSKQIVHVETLPERPPVYADVPGGLNPDVQAVLREQGIERLYEHQADAIAAIMPDVGFVTVSLRRSIVVIGSP